MMKIMPLRAARRKARIAILGLHHESNTFAPSLTDDRDFERGGVFEGQRLYDAFVGTQATIGGFLATLDQSAIEGVPLFFANANPSGVIARKTYESLSSRLVSALADGGPWDGVLVALHGAAVSESELDADGALLTRLRSVVGPETPIGVGLDLHANVSNRMLEASSATVLYRTNPHLDAADRGRECADILVAAIRGEVRPVQVSVPVPIAANILCHGTDSPPLNDLMQKAADLGRVPGMLSASIAVGYPYADVPEMGMSVIAVSDGDHALALDTARRLATEIWARREEFDARARSTTEALLDAMALQGPVLLLDTGDNIGAGSNGASTAILTEARRLGVQRLLATVCDPDAVAACRRAGEGAFLRLTVGEPACGIEARVELLADGRFEDPAPTHGGFRRFDSGPTAVVRTEQNQTLVLVSAPVIDVSIERHRSLGITPEDFHIVVAKGVHSPLPSYGPLARHHIIVGTPGATSADLSVLTYCRRRELFPFEREMEWGR